MAKRTTDIENTNSITTEIVSDVAPKKRGRPKKVVQAVEKVEIAVLDNSNAATSAKKNNTSKSSVPTSAENTSEAKKATKQTAKKTTPKSPSFEILPVAEPKKIEKVAKTTKRVSKKKVENTVEEAAIAPIAPIAEKFTKKSNTPKSKKTEKSDVSNVISSEVSSVEKPFLKPVAAKTKKAAKPANEILPAASQPVEEVQASTQVKSAAKSKTKITASPNSKSDETAEAASPNIAPVANALVEDRIVDNSTKEKNIKSKSSNRSNKQKVKISKANDENTKVVANESAKPEDKKIQSVVAEKKNNNSANIKKQEAPLTKSAPVAAEKDQSLKTIEGNEDSSNSETGEAPRLSWRERNKLRRNRQRLKKKQRRLEAEQQAKLNADADTSINEVTEKVVEEPKVSNDTASESLPNENSNNKKKRFKNKKNKQAKAVDAEQQTNIVKPTDETATASKGVEPSTNAQDSAEATVLPEKKNNQRNKNRNKKRNQQKNQSAVLVAQEEVKVPVESVIEPDAKKTVNTNEKAENQAPEKKVIKKSELDELVENKLRIAKEIAEANRIAAANNEKTSEQNKTVEKTKTVEKNKPAEKAKPVEQNKTVEKNKPVAKPKVEAKEQKVKETQEVKDTVVKKVVPKEPKKPKERPVPINKSKLLTYKQKNDEFISGFLGELEDYLIKELLIDDTSRVLIGVSGGVDSIVLMDAMAILAEKYGFFLFVSHFNHKLREEAADIDEAFVKKTCAEYNIPLYTANGRVKQYAEKNSVSIEMAARFLRYSFFERTTRNIKADYMATAHTADDSAETFIMNLLRGSGLTGLSGIASRRQFIKDVMLIRPLLNMKKADLIKYAKKRKLEWHEDETNSLMQYTRNKVRHELLPGLAKDYNPAIIDVINRSAKLIQGADRIINNYVKVNLPNVCTDIQTEKFAVKIPIFQTFDEFLQGELIIAALLKYFRMQAPPIKTIDRIIKLISSDCGAICEISKSVYAVRDRNTIVFAKKQGGYKLNTIIDKEGKFKFNNFTIILKEVEKKEVTFDENPNIEFFDYDLIPPILYLRNWQAGDSFTPMGMTGSMKVSDFLTNEKVPITDRQNVLVLANKIEIIAIAGKRISDKVKVSKQTKRYLKVEYRFNDK